jgi:hypothetical protein
MTFTTDIKYLIDTFKLLGIVKMRVMPFLIVAYIIWYGSWTASAQSIVQTFVSGVGTTSWWAINRAYGGVGNLIYRGAFADTTYSQGKVLSTQGVWNVVLNAFNKGLVKDTNAVYLVLSSR